MTLGLDTLRSAAQRYPSEFAFKSFSQARAEKMTTAFLCHSHRDEDLARGLQVKLREERLDIYLDWQDSAMPAKPDRVTAQRIQAKIKQSDWFLFLATPNSVTSRWCPWEIGYADRAKNASSIFIIPTYDQEGYYYGNEYLQLYRRIIIANSGSLAAFDPGANRGTNVKRL